MIKNIAADLDRIESSFSTIEELDLWDTRRYGNMEQYCRNIFVATLLYFVSVDNIVMPTEVEFINSMFGFSYQYSEITDICRDMSEELKRFLEAPYEMLATINNISDKIAKEFKNLIIDACELITECDGYVHTKEKNGISKFVSMLKVI